MPRLSQLRYASPARAHGPWKMLLLLALVGCSGPSGHPNGAGPDAGRADGATGDNSAPPPCGAPMQPCCGGGCNLGAACVSGVCLASGADDTGHACTAPSECSGAICLPVGQPTGGSHGGWTGSVCSQTCGTASQCPKGWSCVGPPGPWSRVCECSYSPEVCDGLDNDCDGFVDNSPDVDLQCAQLLGRGFTCLSGGTCGCDRGTGLTTCSRACVDTRMDSQNCGGCGVQCDTLCLAGGCTQALAVTGAFDFTCALLRGGTVGCWGNSPAVAPGLTGATAIAASDWVVSALGADGVVTCSGNNGYGELGNGSSTGVFSSSTPVSGATAIASGAHHICALLAGGSVTCWGSNSNGQLGNLSTVDVCSIPQPGGTSLASCSRVPVQVSLTGATAIAAGGAHTCAVLAGGTVGCWGSNGAGQLGDGTTADSRTPVTSAGLTGATAIAAGRSHTCALLAAGTVVCWGDNQYGELGNGSTSNSSTPVAVPGLSGATSIAARGATTCAILSDGTARCWGDNSHGQLGDGTASGPDMCLASVPCSTSPVQVSNLGGVTSIAPDDGHTCAALASGSVACWGNNTYGELGTATYPSTYSSVPVAVQ